MTTSAQSPITLSELAALRAKIMSGEATMDDMRRAIILLRSDRVTAAGVSERSRATRSRATTAIPDADSMLDEMKDL